jgi:N-acetylglutamate synthase-like GNAT family acetyltransferase
MRNIAPFQWPSRFSGTVFLQSPDFSNEYAFPLVDHKHEVITGTDHAFKSDNLKALLKFRITLYHPGLSYKVFENKVVYICSIMAIRIEPYTDVYKQQVFDLIVPIQQEEFNIPITPEDQPDLQQIPGFYQKDNGNFWLAIAGNTVVGTIALLDIGDEQGALRKMFVHKDYRGKLHGTGQLLLNTLLLWAQQKGLAEIYLGTTAKFLAAHRFYEKNGFEEITVPALPARFPRMEVDVKFYKKRVKIPPFSAYNQ